MSGAEVVVVKARSAWIEQAHEAWERLAAASGSTSDELSGVLRDLVDVDREAFGSLIEALYALGVPVSDELVRLAGLRPVGEVLGLGGSDG